MNGKIFWLVFGALLLSARAQAQTNKVPRVGYLAAVSR